MSALRTLLAPAPLGAGRLRLEGDEVRHALAVLRLEPGDAVRLADGAGLQATARLSAAGRGWLDLDCDPPGPVADPAASAITVALAPPKGDRLGDVVRGLTELGVGAILPLACERGERMPHDLGRCERIAREALKQCRRGCLPRLGPVVGIPDLRGLGGRLILLDRAGRAAVPGAPRPTVLVIGPEGGFTDAESGELGRMGAEAVRLAGPILRIETAAVAAAAVWAAAWETE